MERSASWGQRGAGSPAAGVEAVLPDVLLARELNRAELDRLRAAGILDRVRRGAYVERVASQGPARDARRLALARIRAVAGQLSIDASFCHESAALLWGCPVLHVPDRVHVVQRTRPGPRGTDCLVRHTGVLPPHERATAAGLPVTSLARTVVDCAASLPVRNALVIADAALRIGVRTDEIAAVLARRRGHRGIARARGALALADGRAESPGETLARWELHRAGLPAPELQVPVGTRRGRFLLDLGWPERRIGVEIDGLVKYTGELGTATVQALVAEKLRQEAIEEEGWRLVRATWHDVHAAGPELAARVRRAWRHWAR